MAGPGQVIFKKVGVSERKLILREMADDKTQVTVKGENEEVFHLIAIQFENDEQLLCHHTADSKNHISVQRVVVNFVFRLERYFFQGVISFSSGWVVLDKSSELFQLQRRANARVDLPSNYNASYTLMSVGIHRCFVEAKVRDVSAGGVKIEFFKPNFEIQNGDRLRGALKLGLRRPIECEMEVRHVFEREVEGKVVVAMGLQFLNVDQTFENRLLSLMMDLQRELFIKYPKKS